MFDNLFWLLGPVASAGATFAVLAIVSLPMFWETCSLTKQMKAR